MARAQTSTVGCVGCGYPLSIPGGGEAKVCCPCCGTVNIVARADEKSPTGTQTSDEEDPS